MQISDPKYVYQLAACQPYERYFRVEKGDVVLDVGASISKETLRFAEEAGRNGKVYIVGPNLSNELKSSLDVLVDFILMDARCSRSQEEARLLRKNA